MPIGPGGQGRLERRLDPKVKRKRPHLKKGGAHEKALGHESGAALQK